MYNRDPRLELRVGAFVLVGLAIIAFMVVYFGRLGQGLQRFYDLQVDFPNASGLIAGSDVLLGGARIGYVAKPPRVLPAMQGVAVELKIREDIALPAASRFIIGSSGLLGNRFVDVLVDSDADLEDFIPHGATIEGHRETGLDDMTRQGSEMLADARKLIGTLNESLTRLDETALSQESLDDLRTTIANLRKTSEGLTGLGDDVGKVTKDLEGAAKDIREFVASTRRGPGPLPMLLNDREAAENLRAILTNVRRHGVLWYRDSYRPEPAPSR